MITKLIAVAIHEIRAELRRLETPAAEPDTHRYDPASTISANTERAPVWDHDSRPPVTATVGFRKTPG